jgi:hypothetical protein
MKSGLDSAYQNLTTKENSALLRALSNVEMNATANAYKRPKVTALLEEVAELILACRGKHEDGVELEIIQIAGVAINILWQIHEGREDEINNIITHRDVG